MEQCDGLKVHGQFLLKRIVSCYSVIGYFRWNMKGRPGAERKVKIKILNQKIMQRRFRNASMAQAYVKLFQIAIIKSNIREIQDIGMKRQRSNEPAVFRGGAEG